MKTKKAISFLLKITIVFCAILFLYNQISVKLSDKNFIGLNIFQDIRKNTLYIFLVFVMMLFNWVLEALKWRFLIKKVEDISFLQSIRAIFSGITVSTFTPNRIGEYGGRIFCLNKADRIQSILITIIGSIAQLLITIFFGLIGTLYVFKYFPDYAEYILNSNLLYAALIALLILLNVFFIFLFLNTSLIHSFLGKFSFFKKFDKYIQVFSFYDKKELSKVLLFSLARYIVFTTQFYILLNIFNVIDSYFVAIPLIMTMLFVISVIPTIIFTEISVRGSVALFLFGLISPNIIGILTATFFIWVINLVIPAVIGTAFVFSLKFFRK
tara:strand:+ start:862 stop:1839 length:978 start_codon:yes stop_codon:yes gene_type:complete